MSTPCFTSTGLLAPGLPTWDSSSHGAARRTSAFQEPRELRFHPHAPKRSDHCAILDGLDPEYCAHQGGAFRSTREHLTCRARRAGYVRMQPPQFQGKKETLLT